MRVKETSREFREFLKRDFRNCLVYVWKRLNLPNPTPLQLDIANFIQDAANPRIIVEAYRGIGKTIILTAFCVWTWLRHPNHRILVSSGSKGHANKFTTMTKRMIDTFPAFQHLRSRRDQRQSNYAFDVGPAEIDKDPSLSAIGITGQITGSRADLEINDDIETANNSQTQAGRDYIQSMSKELANIVKPAAEGGRIIYLGTPQHEASIYNILRKERGYLCRIWPARYPTADQLEGYEGFLAPTLAQRLVGNPGLVGTATDPIRFDDRELAQREAELGKSAFALQYMMDTSLSDSERYPLKINDLMVMPLSTDKGPLDVTYSSDPHYIVEGIPSVGFSGDVWRRPYGLGNVELGPYTGSVMAIDPAGRGGDETAYAIVKILNARLFLLACRGLKGGYDDSALRELAMAAKLHKVNTILIESNFGDGMFSKVFSPILGKIHPCAMEDVRSTVQKEKRIIDTLEPIMNQHRLIVAEDVAIGDYRGSNRYENQLFFQLTRLTKERGCLGKDDRIDVLAMACAYWLEHMARDVDKATTESMEELVRKEFEEFDNDLRGGGHDRRKGWI